MAEIYAWVVVAVAGLATLAGVFLLTRPIKHAFLKTLLRCLAAVWLLLPWQIGVVEGKYAPAFIVALFEGLFRREGNPWPALTVLAVGSLAVLVVLLVAEVVKRARTP
jgi:hypothetical protein